jgi:hypothetical protein
MRTRKIKVVGGIPAIKVSCDSKIIIVQPAYNDGSGPRLLLTRDRTHQLIRALTAALDEAKRRK